MTKELTEKEKKFADYYIETLNGKASYQKAFNNNNARSCEVRACELLKRPHIKAYIDSRLEEAKNERTATIQDVLEFWTDVMNNNYKKLGYSKPIYVKDRLVASENLMKRLEVGKDTNKDIKIQIVGAFDEQ